MSWFRSLLCIPRQAGRAPILLIVAVALAAAGGTFAVTQFAGKEGGSGAKSEPGDGKRTLGPAETVDLGEFLVNVTDTGQALRYVKAEVSLVVQLIGAETEEAAAGSGHGGGAKKEEGRQLPPDDHRLARDAVIRVVCAHSFEDLVKANGREKLRAALRNELDRALETYRVNEVLITSFVMQ